MSVQEVEKLKSDFADKLNKKRRYLDEEDLQALLNQYHKGRYSYAIVMVTFYTLKFLYNGNLN